MTDLPIGQDSTATTPLGASQSGDVIGAGSPAGDHDPADKHHVINKAMGFIGKAGHFRKKLMRRKKRDKAEGSSSSEDLVTSSGEVTPISGGSGRLEPPPVVVKEPGRPISEGVPVSGPGPGVAKQLLPSASKQFSVASQPQALHSPSVPPSRPPPGVPQPVASSN